MYTSLPPGNIYVCTIKSGIGHYAPPPPPAGSGVGGGVMSDCHLGENLWTGQCLQKEEI